MSKNNNTQQEDEQIGIEVALTKSEQFIEKNQKTLSYIAIGIIVIISLYMSFQKLYIEPQEDDARSNMFVAEQYFQKDSFNLALNGDGNYFGFLDIISDYKMTKTANLSKYYAGVCYLQLGDYEEAISYLKSFSSDDIIISSIANGCIGDAYSELQDYNKAISYYKKATDTPNDLSTPIYLSKAALLYEEIGDYKKALNLYEQIQKDYPKSQEGRNIEKYIARVKIKL
jgi:tetratricopeptide (TPR) repeat protein